MNCFIRSLALGLPLVMASACGDLTAKKSDTPAPKNFQMSLSNQNKLDFDFDHWRMTLKQPGSDDQTFTQVRYDSLAVHVAPGSYEAVIEFLKDGNVIASNNVPPCEASKITIGTPFSFQLCRFL